MRTAKYIRSWDISGLCDRPGCPSPAVEVWAVRETGELLQLCRAHADELADQSFRDHLESIRIRRERGIPLTVGYWPAEGWRDVEVKPDGRIDHRWGGPVTMADLRPGDQVVLTDSEGLWFRSLFQYGLGAEGEPPGPLTIIPYPAVILFGLRWSHVILGNSRGDVVLNRTIRRVSVDATAHAVLRADVVLGILASFLAGDSEIGMRELRALLRGFTKPNQSAEMEE